MADQPTFSIPKEIIEPIITAQVAAAITTALADKNYLTEQLINRVLMQKVDANGNVSQYSYQNEYPWFEYMARKLIQDQVRECFKEEIAKQAPRIKELARAELTKKNSPLIKMMVDGMAKSVTALAEKADYRLTVAVESVSVRESDF